MNNKHDPFEDTPENREWLQRTAETYAEAQGMVYTVVRDKESGRLAVQPKSMFDPTRDEVLFEHSNGGQKAADERWEARWKRLREQG